MRAEALLFAAARADHLEKTIQPALDRGAWVVSDRFLDSSLAYQGGAGGLGMEAVRALHRFGSSNFLPDRTLIASARGRPATMLPWSSASGRSRAKSPLAFAWSMPPAFREK
jgi:hypothetical protein